MVEIVKIALLLVVAFYFSGGEAIVTAAGGMEHVVVKDSRGIVQSDSYCDAQSGNYGQIVRLGARSRMLPRGPNRAR